MADGKQVTAGTTLQQIKEQWHLDSWRPLRKELDRYRRSHGRLPYGVAKQLQMAFVFHFEVPPEGIVELWDAKYEELEQLAYHSLGTKPFDPYGSLTKAVGESKPPSREILRKCRIDRDLKRLAVKLADRLRLQRRERKA